MAKGLWNVRSTSGRLVVLFPGPLSAAAAAHIRDVVDEAEEHPGRPLILPDGAQVRMTVESVSKLLIAFLAVSVALTVIAAVWILLLLAGGTR